MGKISRKYISKHLTSSFPKIARVHSKQYRLQGRTPHTEHIRMRTHHPKSEHLDEQLPRAQDKARVCVADAGRKLPESARIAGVRVRAKQHLPCMTARP